MLANILFRLCGYLAVKDFNIIKVSSILTMSAILDIDMVYNVYFV